MAHPPVPLTVQGEARVFGHDPAAVTLQVVPRTTGWRAGRALRWLAAGVIVAPVVAVLPPHAPWAVAAGTGGVVLALRKWGERFTLVGLEGSCPRCGAPLVHHGSTPLKTPHSTACEGCGNPVALHVDLSGLEAT